MRGFFCFSFAALVGVVACDKSTTDASPGGGTTTELKVCDPLVVAPEPIKLRTVLAAGRAADGTIWLLDHNGPQRDMVLDERLFRSNGNVFQRVMVSGSGSESGGPLGFYTAIFAEGQIRIEIANGVPTRMGKTSSVAMDPKTKSFEIDASNELTLVGADVYGSMSVANLSGQTLTFDGTTSDGKRFIVFQPTVDFSEDKVRVFYGTDDRLLQRKLSSRSQGKSLGGATIFTFDVDGVETTATIAVGPYARESPHIANAAGWSSPLTAADGSPGYGDVRTPYDPLSDAAIPSVPPRKPDAELTAGLTFVCF